MKKILIACICFNSHFFAAPQKADRIVSHHIYQKIAGAAHLAFEKYETTAPDWLPDDIGLINLKKLNDQEFLDQLHSLMSNETVKALVIVFSPHDVEPGLLMREIELAKKIKPLIAFIEDECFGASFVAAAAATYVMALPSIRVGRIGAKLIIQKNIFINDAVIYKTSTYSVIDETYAGGECKGYINGLQSNNNETENYCFEAIQQFVNNKYEELRDQMATYRNLDRSNDRIWAHGRSFATQEAHDLGLIDSLGCVLDALQVARQLLEAEQLSSAICKGKGFINELTQQAYCLPTICIATITISGGIENDDQLDKTINRMRMASLDQSVRGLLITINSTGGDMTGAYKIYHEIIAAKKNKPVIVLIAGYGMSAGYYIASAAHAICAVLDSTIGNIGTMSTYQRVDVQKEYKYTDPETKRESRLEHKAISAGDHTCPDKPCQASKSELDDWAQRLYKDFIQTVSNNRRLSLPQSSEWADGKLFSARQALKLGLIDFIGGYTEAIAHLLHGIAKENDGIVLDDLPPIKIVNLTSEAARETKEEN